MKLIAPYREGKLPSHREVYGFTLIELLVCLSIVLILSLVAVPNMGQWLKSNQVSATANYLKSHLALMRAEAVRQGVDITLCRSEDQQTCAGTSLRGKQQWLGGLLFVDHNNNRMWDTDTEALIRHLDLTSNIYVVWNRGDAIRYQPSGYLNPSTIGSFYVFDENDMENGSRLVAQMTGRVRSTHLSSSERRSLALWLTPE